METRQSAAEIESEAVRWLWRMDRAGADAALESALQDWLASDTRCGGAFLKAQATWAVLEQSSACDEVPTPAAPRPRLPKVRNARAVHLIAAGAAFVMIATVAAAWFAGFDRYRTAVGEIRQVPLEDSSTVVINTASAIAVSMNDTRRKIELQRGEAWFQVARDKDRPFVVETGRVRVRALGTAFSIRRHQDGAEVLVTEGVVETWVAGAEGHTVQVAAGAKARVADNAAITVGRLDTAQMDRMLAWRTGRIDLAGDTLEWAVAEFNRYNHRKLVIDSPQLARQRLYGVFRINDPEGFANAIKRSLDAEVASVGRREIRLRGAHSGV